MNPFTALVLLAATSYALTLAPPSNGTYGTDIVPIELIDHSRTDPYDPHGGPRKVMISAIYPTVPRHNCQPSTYPYAPPTTAASLDILLNLYGFANGSASIGTLSLSTCPVPHTLSTGSCGPSYGAYPTLSSYPVVLFSHGSGLSRLLSSAQAQSVASQGFIVLTIDHTYNAGIVEFLDGSTVTGIALSNNSLADSEIRLRSKDASFIIDQLSLASSPLRQALPQLTGNEKVAMFGHSLGGASSARAAYDDSRVRGAINLDGFPYGWTTTGNVTNPVFDALPQGIETPFVLFNAAVNVDVQAYVNLYNAFSGYKKQLLLANSQHLAFTDFPLLADALNARTAQLELYTGNITGVRARDSVASYVAAFMEYVLNDEEDGLLRGPSPEFPEVSFARESP